MSLRRVILLFALCLGGLGVVQAAAIVPGFNANTLARNDDGSTAAVALGFEVDLFGTRTSQVFVNNNGNVTFDAPLSSFTPFNLLQTSQLIVAPFFADVDTRAAGDPVTYGSGSYEGRPAFGVNWINVDYYFSSAAHTRRNSFQLILVSRSDRAAGDFDIVFNYDRIQWETGEASQGNADGLGGFSARAGYAIGAGAPGSAFELSGSAVNGALLDGGPDALVAGSRGSNQAGRYVFEIRGSQTSQVSTLTPFGDAPSLRAASSGSGRYVVFESAASNLIAGDARKDANPGTDVFRVDTQTGLTTLVSLDAAGQPLQGDAAEATVDESGQLIAFVAPDAGVGAVHGESAEKRSARHKSEGFGVFLRNILTGTTHRVGDATASGSGSAPRISAAGTHVVYTAPITDPALGQVGQNNIFRVPLTRAGDAVSLGSPQCLSCKAVSAGGADTAAPVDGASGQPAVSADGSMVVWQTTAKNYLAGSTPACAQASSLVVARNMLTGALSTLSQPAAGGSCGSGGATAPQIDHAGRTVVFGSTQPLAAADSNGQSDIYAINLGGGSVQQVSVSSSGGQGNGASTAPSLSGDGKVVAFSSTASNLDPSGADGNGAADVHVHALGSAQTLRLSNTDSGTEANGPSDRPALNFDGSRIAFDSVAGNLAAGAVGGISQVFQRANPLVAPLRRSATWWNEDESGWGLFIFDQGNVLLPAWFTYDTDGEPTWFLVAGAFLQADGSYVGEVFRFTGVPFDQISGAASDPETSVGSVTLRFSGETGLRFDYVVNGISQSKQMTRFPFGSRTLGCRAASEAQRQSASNFSDVWFDSGSPGWGLFINQVDEVMVAVWYTYDSDREALFMVFVGERQPDGSFSGEVFRQRNGTPFSQINAAPPSPGSDVVGTARLSFSSGTRGSFAYTLGSVSQSKPIERLQAGSVATLCESLPAD
jgi:hypothetical protein